EAFLFEPKVRAEADFRAQGDDLEGLFGEKSLEKVDFSFAATTDDQLHAGDLGDGSLVDRSDGCGGFDVSPQAPDEDVRVDQHGRGWRMRVMKWGTGSC